MARTSNVKIRIKAIDNVTKTLDRVTKRFPKMTRQVRRASRSFAILQKRTEKLRKTLSRVGGKMKGVGQSMTLGLSAPIGLAGAAILRTGVNFQKAINKVGAITGTIVKGQVTKDFQALENQAMLLGRTTEFSATQAAEAMALLGRAGFKTNEILETTDDVLALASASGNELAFTADVMAKTMRAFGIDAAQAGRVSDVLSDISRRTNVDLETISETFKDAAPIAKAYGATLEQTAAITGLLGDVGIQGSKAGTTLKAIMLKLAAPSKKAGDIMKVLGIQVTKGANGMNDVGAILTQLGPKLGKFPKQAQLAAINELFGLRGIAGAAALMSKAIDEGKNPVAEMTKLLQGSAGVAKEMQQTMLRGAPGALARFESALEGVGLAFAKSGLLDSFTDFLDMLAGLFGVVAKLPKPILLVVVGVGAFAAAVGPLLILMGSFLAMLPYMVTGMAALSAVSLPITGSFLLIASAITAVVAAIALLVKNWDKVKAFFSFASSAKGGAAFGQALAGGGSFGAFGAPKKQAFGPPVGAQNANQQASEARTQNQTMSGDINVNFKNAPAGMQATSKASGPLGLNLGFSGALQ